MTEGGARECVCIVYVCERERERERERESRGENDKVLGIEVGTHSIPLDSLMI